MKRIPTRKNAGVTLIEVIIAMALMGLVVIASYSVISFGRLYAAKSQEEYNFQFSTRMTLQATSNIIRYSTAVFTIPESSFRSDNLDAGWDYVGIQEVEISPGVISNEIVKYVYDDATGTHISTVLIPPQSDVVYKFTFTKVNPQDEDSLLQFSIQSYPAGRLNEYGLPSAAVTVTSEVEAKNSLQVIDLSSQYDPAVAVAFRPDERIRNVVGHVAMVLDTSGSMADNLSGGSSGSSRISILKSEAKTLINNFANEDNIDIALIPFATSANNPFAFQNARANDDALRDDIDDLYAIGGTNTGDGLRRAYWALYDHSHDLGAGVRASNYVIILVDGVTTFASMNVDPSYPNDPSKRTYITGDGDVDDYGYLDRNDPHNSSSNIAGNGSELDSYGTNYVNRIGTTMLNRNSFAKAYVIGFSSISSELNSVNDIADACGAPSERVFRAGSSLDLSQVFDEIRQDIVNDLWYLQGPQL